MKTLLMASLALLASFAQAKAPETTPAKTSTPAGWTDDYEKALKQAAKEKKFLLVDFSGSDWCGWCKRLDREVFSTEAFLAGATNRFVLVMVDMPNDQTLLSKKAKEQNPRLIKKFGIRGFPTVLVLDKKEKVLFKTGYRPNGPEAYLKELADALEGQKK